MHLHDSQIGFVILTSVPKTYTMLKNMFHIRYNDKSDYSIVINATFYVGPDPQSAQSVSDSYNWRRVWHYALHGLVPNWHIVAC